MVRFPHRAARRCAAALALALAACAREPPPAEPGRSPRTPAEPSRAAPAAPEPVRRTPRERADELYNAAMMAHESGDRARAEPALALAMMAYAQTGDPDDDALYHLSTLQFAAGKHAQARATAERILGHAPDHLLALGGAARAAGAAGDKEAAAAYWRRFLDALDSARPRPEYEHHQRILPVFEQQAREALGR